LKPILGLATLTLSLLGAQNIKQQHKLVAYALHIHACEVPGINPDLVLVNSPPLACSATTPTQPGGNSSQGIKTFQGVRQIFKKRQFVSKKMAKLSKQRIFCIGYTVVS